MRHRIMSSSEGDERYSSTSSNNDCSLEMSLDEQMTALQEKLQRTTKFIQEIQNLSPACEESNDSAKEKQVFNRRILQVSAELQDARDVVYALCRPPRLSQRQFELVTSEDTLEDPANDPSVRFFGIDWQQLFAKCFSLSFNVQILKGQVVEGGELDLVLLSTILKAMASVETDILSHGEAVTHGRLSKSQQEIIQREQVRLSAIGSSNSHSSNGCKNLKSRSFRDVGGQRKQRQLSKYKKNKTTDLNKLTSSLSMSESMSQPLVTAAAATDHSDEWEEVLKSSSSTTPKRKSSFIQNVSSIFKNIR